MLPPSSDWNQTATHIASQYSVKGAGKRGLPSDNNEELNKGAYHPESNNLPNQVVFWVSIPTKKLVQASTGGSKGCLNLYSIIVFFGMIKSDNWTQACIFTML